MEYEVDLHCKSSFYFEDDDHNVRAFLYNDYKIRPHTHDFYEMNIILGGSGIHMIENAHIPVKTGDVFVIPPMMVHSYYDTNQLDVYHIIIKPSFITDNSAESAKMPGFLQFVEIEPFLRQNASKSMFLHLSHSKREQLINELPIIEDGGVFDTDELLPMKHHTTWKIIYWLSYLLYVQMSSKASTSNKHEILVLRSLEYMHKHYHEKITIDTLCKLTFLSRSTFLKNFESICNCTPSHYLNSYRAKKAEEMLSNHMFSKTYIAHACGFYDLSHMERTLKQFNKANK